MGELFRRFWLPVALAEELPGPDCDPVRTRVLSEDLILFRDTNGRPGLVDAYCPHRGAPMFFGRNEESGLRCVYHGWKFDVEGTCTDLPNAPEGETFKQKVRIAAYPCVEKAGMIWAYMGPAEKQPPLPGFEWLGLPATHTYVKKFRLECNYLQAMEGDYDASHASFLHTTLGDSNLNPAVRVGGIGNNFFDKMAHYVAIEDTPVGLTYISTSQRADDSRSYSAGHWMMPIFCTAGIAGPNIYSSNMRIPIDDNALMFYRFRWSYDPIPASEIQEYQWGGYVYPELVPGTYIPTDNKANDYNIDRVAQRNYSYTGIRTFPLQDIAMMEDQRGPIMDRTREHLASSDEIIIRVRRKLLRAARALAEGVEPEAPRATKAWAIHTARVIVPNSMSEADALARLKPMVTDPTSMKVNFIK
jgi:phenylpropionate dioxygenase-like ring-hydroxylating dioxygenase large terminal subunit